MSGTGCTEHASAAGGGAATRRDFLRTVGAGAIAATLTGAAHGARASESERPNILLIMTDDQGIETLRCYGGESYNTPNLDALAATGVRFDHCYSSPRCVPTRANILTGRYGFRTGWEWGHLPASEITFGHVLGEAGYATAVAGKWQLALLEDDPAHPHKMGFDDYALWAWHEGPRYWNPMIWQNAELRHEDIAHRYGPWVFAEFINDHMLRQRGRPFLAYYPMVLPHFPKMPGERYEEPPGPHGRYQSYAEMIGAIDEIVGRLVNTLDRHNLRENTVVIFTCDNGAPQRVTSRFRGREVEGGKRSLTDRGTHVPLIVNWKGVSPPGAVCKDLIEFSDFLPTLADLAGAPLPEVLIDGQSFAPQIRGERGDPREWIYVEDRPLEGWVRDHAWKLYRSGELHHMIRDPDEENPIPPGDDTPVSAAVRQKFAAILEQLQ